jgi:hypothetical protein
LMSEINWYFSPNWSHFPTRTSNNRWDESNMGYSVTSAKRTLSPKLRWRDTEQENSRKRSLLKRLDIYTVPAFIWSKYTHRKLWRHVWTVRHSVNATSWNLTATTQHGTWCYTFNWLQKSGFRKWIT